MKNSYTKDSVEYDMFLLAGFRLAYDRAMDRCDYDTANIKCAQADAMEKQIVSRLMRENRLSFQQAQDWINQ